MCDLHVFIQPRPASTGRHAVYLRIDDVIVSCVDFHQVPQFLGFDPAVGVVKDHNVCKKGSADY